MPALVEASIRAIELRFCEITLEECDWAAYQSQHASVAAHILENIFHNVKRHGSVERPAVSVRVAQARWDGRKDDLVIVDNFTKVPMGQVRARQLYRALDARQQSPETTVTIPRLGAYLAGKLARSLHGDVHGVLLGDLRLRSIVAIPAPDHAAER
jgi:hypothetical protein